MGFVIFVSAFLGFMAVISIILNVPLMKEIKNSNDNSNIVKFLISFSDDISTFPIIGGFMSLVLNTITISYVHPYMIIFYGSLIGIPLGFVILTLIRGS